MTPAEVKLIKTRIREMSDANRRFFQLNTDLCNINESLIVTVRDLVITLTELSQDNKQLRAGIDPSFINIDDIGKKNGDE